VSSLKRRVLEYGFRQYYEWRLAEFYPNQLIELDYPVHPQPRFELGGPPHPELAAWFNSGRRACEDALRAMAALRDVFESIPRRADDPRQPYWDQKWFTALDAMALYTLILRRRPRRIIEVGSGHSTKFAARAIRDHHLATTLTSIDPEPRAEIDALCSTVERTSLERMDLAIFADLADNDFLVVDSSHRALPNSDVTTLFLEVLPRLKPGVVLHLHDIFLPWDYPRGWGHRYYSEQYMLACWLLAGPERLRLVLSNAFVSQDRDLRRLAMELFGGSDLGQMVHPEFRYGQLQGIAGCSFWAEVV
jgi:predicted O-methyltransferase YrrM